MKIEIKDLVINYTEKGCGQPIIFLHGWGMNLHTFDKVSSFIDEDFKVYQIDLPGFGESDIKSGLDVDDYATIINEFCLKLSIINPIIVGHSFGGRVAISYASKYIIKKLILISSPGIKDKFNLIKWLKIKVYKLLKKLSLKTNMGSIDYKNSMGFLKEVLVKAVNKDLKDEILKINVPTLLIYGKKDKTVRVKMGKKISNLIKNSSLITVDDAKHFPYIERFRYFLIVFKSFLFSDNL